jgi:hypothetical protein
MLTQYMNNMDFIPARCVNPSCGAVFPSPIPYGVGSVLGCSTNCPYCGSNAAIANGISGSSIERKSSNYHPTDAFSMQTIDKMQRILSAYQKGQIDKEAALLASALLPAKQRKAVVWAINYNKATFVLALIVALYTLARDNSNDKFNEKLISIMQQQNYTQTETLRFMKEMQIKNSVSLNKMVNSSPDKKIEPGKNRHQRRSESAQNRQVSKNRNQ